MRSQVMLAVDASGISGHGVFAEHDIEPGRMIHRMGGKRVSLLQCIYEIAAGRVSIDDPLQIAPFTYIILDAFSNRFNHSCEPNAVLTGEADLVALKAIAKGDEITFDYSLTVKRTVFTAHWKMPCQCGSAGCRGKVSNIDTVPLHIVTMNFRRRTLQDYMLKAIASKLSLDSVPPPAPVDLAQPGSTALLGDQRR